LQLAKIKINVKSLAAESVINRKEATKLSGLDRHDLNEHRKTSIRTESRVAQWVYAYARGVPKKVIEPDARKLPSYLSQMMKKRGTEKAKRMGINPEGFGDWLEAG
jgi:hypothetical protein